MRKGLLLVVLGFLIPVFVYGWTDPGTWDSFKKALTQLRYSIIPVQDDVELGSSSQRFNKIWVKDIDISGGTSTASQVIEGTLTIDTTDVEALLVRQNEDSGDVFVVDTDTPKVMIKGTGLYLEDDRCVNFGDSADVRLKYSGKQVVNCFLVGLDTTSLNVIIAPNNFVENKDFGCASQANPTVFLFSSTDPAVNDKQWMSFSHNQTDGVISVGEGSIKLDGGVKFKRVAVTSGSYKTTKDDYFVGVRYTTITRINISANERNKQGLNILTN